MTENKRKRAARKPRRLEPTELIGSLAAVLEIGKDVKFCPDSTAQDPDQVVFIPAKEWIESMTVVYRRKLHPLRRAATERAALLLQQAIYWDHAPFAKKDISKVVIAYYAEKAVIYFKAARHKRALTPADVAEKLGVVRTTIITWENGATPMQEDARRWAFAQHPEEATDASKS